MNERRKCKKRKQERIRRKFNEAILFSTETYNRKGKLEPKWVGPYVVNKLKSVESCKINNIKTKKVILSH